MENNKDIGYIELQLSNAPLLSNNENVIEMKTRNTTKEIQDNPLLGLLVAMDGGRGIEEQEAQGQRQLVHSDQLPSKNNGYRKTSAKEQYEQMGIKVVGVTEGDPLFLDVELPEGWKKKSTGHSMWNELLDDKGRVRATFFYKAAFYDRDAFVNFNRRYVSTYEYTETKAETDRFHPKYYCVIDNATGEPIFKTAVTKEYEDEALRKEAEDYLSTNYPNHEDITAYWD